MPDSVQLESITREIEYRDPVLLFHHLAGARPGSLLLESAEIDSKRHLNSFLMTRAALSLRCEGRLVTVTALTDNGRRLLEALASRLAANISRADLPTRQTASWAFTTEWPLPDSSLDEDERLVAPSVLTPLRELIECVRVNSTIREALFAGGLFGYDLVECFEPLPPVNGMAQCPDYVFFVAEHLIHLDHQAETGRLTGSYFYNRPDAGDRQAVEAEIDDAASRCRNLSLLDLPPCEAVDDEVRANRSDAEFATIVERLKGEIIRGEVFQIVPSRSFTIRCPNPLRAYRRLRKLNPGPYMFFLADEEFTLFGASPEMAIRFDAATRQVEICPIAGTRPRGKHPDGSINADLDSRIELELRSDAKEMAEHLMLVDLARNDLARICEAGSRHVARLLKVDRYSHVMHLVSRVVGQLRRELDALHAWQACMNMGTLTGAPKVRAMQLIREIERARRDHYGGAIGYLLGNGDMENCIVIRAALVTDHEAHVQAGAGVVFDSDPASEAAETRNKAAAVLAALQSAHLS